MKAIQNRLTPGLAVLAALLLGTGPALAGEAERAQAKVDKAQALMTEIQDKTDGWAQWKSTSKVLGNAEQSLKQGDYEAAIDAAEEVILQAEKGLDQYRREKTEHTKAVGAARQSGNLQEEEWTEGDG